MIALTVQTWGTEVAALRRYWAAADDAGFARVVYGDGLWDWTHTAMLTRFAERVLPQLARAGRR